ncbi:hypothetical protein RA27_06810 [Ruegeria sp. ANG-R]|nr:hypothetical protein RA27_06810 [Ruegeria sp. ANG-R]
MLQHDFRRLLDTLEELNPAQIADAQTKIQYLRQQTEAISEIEARTNREHGCPFCGDERRQNWDAPELRFSDIGATAAKRRIQVGLAPPLVASIGLTCS